MSKIRGKAKRYDGAPIDYVSLFNWIDGKCIAQVVPDSAGNWVYDYFKDLNIGITYVSNGCEPITHGEYEFTYQFNPLDDALLHYDFNGDSLDKSASNLNGIKTGNASFVTGRKAGTQAIEFIAGCVKTPTVLPLGSDRMTVSFWMKSISTSMGIIFEVSNNSNDFVRAPVAAFNNFEKGSIDFGYAYNIESGIYNIVKSPINVSNAWQHIILETDTSRVGAQENRIYVDNVLTSTYIEGYGNNGSGNIHNGIWHIGQRAASSLPYIGSLQDFRVFNRILTAEERAILFNE